jgi:LuxR family maltose regulon positive regulatory protein
MSKPETEPARRTENILRNKLLAPRLHANTIQRGVLLARLDVGLTKKLTLVAAPTGFGKTTLVRQWIESREGEAAWVTLDEYDNDPVRFWTYVCSALRTIDASLGRDSLSMLLGPQPPSFATLLTPLINDLARLETRSVLVLDDYHTIKSTDIHDGISFLIQHLPQFLHLVFITRSEPNLPLGLLRARDELVEIDTPNLRFNQREAEVFLQTITQIDLPSSAVVRLWQKTEGWPAGLLLGALTLQNKGNQADLEKWIESFSGGDRYIADYLIKEVFESQSGETQSFLLRTSFFERLTGSLCDALLGTNHSAATLEQLERDNIFIVQLERGGDQIWYRYNPLFAESLQYLAKQRLEDAEIKRLFEKASDWHEYHGLFDEAIETALTAKLFDRAMALIEKFIEIHDMSALRTLGRWLENIPPQEILRNPIICFTNAQVILYSTDRFAPATAARIEPFLRAAEIAWRKDEDHQRLGQLLSFRGNVVWWQGDFEKAFDYSRQSLDELPDHDVFWRGNSLLSVGHEALSVGQILLAQDKILEARALLGAAQNIFGVLAAVQFLAEIFYWQGELEQAEQLNQQILKEAVGEESMLDDQGIANLHLAQIAYERNDLDQAEQFAERALALAEGRSNELLQVPASIWLASIYAAKDNLSRARELVKSLEAKVQNLVLLREIQNAQALLSIRSHDISPTELLRLSLDWWVKIVSKENQSILHLQKEREAFALMRLRIAEGKANEALNMLEQWQEDAAQNGRVRSQVEALCLEALAYHAAGNVSEAAQSLNGALSIGHTKGFRRIFLDEGKRMAALLQAIVPTLPNRTLSLFAATLLHSFPPEATAHITTSGSKVQIEALSPQEMRVLRLLVAGLPNADIAQELVISTNTIKTHVKSIYRKLNVSSRTEAREVARGLKLL